MAALVQSWSVMVRMESYSCDGGRSTMRSRVIISKGKALAFVVMGYTGILGFVVLLLVCWQTAHPLLSFSYHVTRWEFSK